MSTLSQFVTRLSYRMHKDVARYPTPEHMYYTYNQERTDEVKASVVYRRLIFAEARFWLAIKMLPPRSVELRNYRVKYLSMIRLFNQEQDWLLEKKYSASPVGHSYCPHCGALHHGPSRTRCQEPEESHRPRKRKLSHVMRTKPRKTPRALRS